MSAFGRHFIAAVDEVVAKAFGSDHQPDERPSWENEMAPASANTDGKR